MPLIYIRAPIETLIGTGDEYYEVDAETGYPRRQVAVIDGKYYSSRQDYHPGVGLGLADQPFSPGDLTRSESITPEEFEDVWSAAA